MAFLHIQVCVLFEHRLHVHASDSAQKQSLRQRVDIAKWVLFCCWLHFSGLRSLVYKRQRLKTCANVTFLWPRSTTMSCEHVTTIETVKNLYRLTHFYQLIVSAGLSPTLYWPQTFELLNCICCKSNVLSHKKRVKGETFKIDFNSLSVRLSFLKVQLSKVFSI